MNETGATRARYVGVELQDVDENRAIVEAIQQDNPEAEAVRMPGMIRVTVPGHLVIRRNTVEERLGRSWDTQEFQMAIISYVGHIGDWDEDQILIKWQH